MLAAETPINAVSVVGGGARNLYWGKILATALNRPLVYREDRAAGAARLAWLGVHTNVSPEVAFIIPPIEETIEPQQNLLEFFGKKRTIFESFINDCKMYLPMLC